MLKILFLLVIASNTVALPWGEVCDRCVQMVERLRQLPVEDLNQARLQHICFESYVRCSHGNKYCSLWYLTEERVHRIQAELQQGGRNAQVCDRALEICRIE
ncbi:unnamed protein product, partial [Mesorhabditis spiculigera]